MINLRLGDCLDVLREMPADSVDSIVTDPPYGLEFMGKAWDKLGRQSGKRFSKPGIGDRPTEWTSFSSTSRFAAANPTCATCGGRLRGKRRCECVEPVWKPIGKRRNAENEGLPDDVTGGGMKQQLRGMQDWHERWAREAFRVAKPGAHLLAFGGTRTFHRLTCAIEDAGWEIRDCLMWVYGSGFPKSLDVSKAIDKAAGAERGKGKQGGTGPFGNTGRCLDCGLPYFSGNPCQCERGDLVPITPAARQWSGWGTALKPAWEPVILARKPLSEKTVAANVLRWGTGAINVDGCRVEGVPRVPGMRSHGHSATGGGHTLTGSSRDRQREYDANPPSGRWPANLCLSYPEDEYELRDDVTPAQLRALAEWMDANT